MKKYVILLLIGLLGLSWYTAISEAVNDPKELEAHLKKAAELEEKEIYIDAVTEYEAALEYAPERTDLYLKMANACLLSGDAGEFIDICEEQAESNQEDPEALDMLMEYYVERENYADALQYLQKFRASYPDNENGRKWFLELEGTYEELYCRYDAAGDIVNETIAVESDGLFGIADASGQKLIDCEYQESNPFSEDGFALVCTEEGKYLYIDQEGRTRKVPDAQYDDLGMFESDRATARINGKYGYLDEEMEPAGAFEWDQLTGIKNGVGAGENDGKWMLLDKDGEPVSEERYEEVVIDPSGFCSYQNRIFVKTDGEYAMINQKGKRVGDLSFDDAKPFTDEGYAAVCKNGKWGFADQEGELVIDYTYEDAESFSNGFAAVCVDGLWGYIDAEGNMAVEPEFTEASHFSSEGTAVVRRESQEDQTCCLIQLILFQ